MELILQKIIFMFAIGLASRYCVNGDKVHCACSGNFKSYINAAISNKMTLYSLNGKQPNDEVGLFVEAIKNQNQLFAQIDSMKKHNQTFSGIDSLANPNQLIDKIDSLKNAIELFDGKNSMSNQTEVIAELDNIIKWQRALLKGLSQLRKQKERQDEKDMVVDLSQTHSDCLWATFNSRRSGFYVLQVGTLQFTVSCSVDYGGGWTMILKRKDGSINFYRQWNDYKEGFGTLKGEFFIGLDKLYALTNDQYKQELIIVLEDFDGVRKYAHYSSFAIGHESEGYVLKSVGEYSGDAGDSLTYHLGATFKTSDAPDVKECAKKSWGAWWYKDCHTSNLCGAYFAGPYDQSHFGQGVVWSSWHGYYYSLRLVEMMIRPNLK